MTPDDDSGKLFELAGRVADESPVSWDDALVRLDATPEDIEALRLVESVVSAHRSVAATLPPGLKPEPRSTPLFTWGSLEVLEKIGEGSFGEVYRARETLLGRDVALKLRRLPARNFSKTHLRDLEEARRLARVHHPNVLVIHGVAIHEGRAGFWTALIEGETLEARLKHTGPVPYREACLDGIEVCRALAAVHAAGLIHGDVKASNVMRETGGRIVLMDFGSVSERGNAGTLATTPLSSAPEVLRGDVPGFEADVYSVGVLLYRLVTGRFPIEASDLATLSARAERGEHRPLRDLAPNLPARFVACVEKALAPRAADRFSSAGHLEAALASALEIGVPATEPALVRRSRGPVLLVALGLTALSVAAIVMNLRPPRDSSDRSSASAPPVATSERAVDITATLLRTGALESEPLVSGAVVRPGDALHLLVEIREPAHVYVLDEDEQGSAYLLFPVAGVDLRNPLPAGRHRLPGRKGGEDLDWQVTSSGGRETIVILASRTPLASIEKRVADLPQAELSRPVVYAELNPEDFRGIGGLMESPVLGSGTKAPRIAEIAKGLRNRDPGEDGLWVRMIELRNPEP